MSLELWLSNLWFYSLQTGILILVGGLLAWIFRLRAPGGVHLYWRLLLAGCLILAFQPGVPGALPDPVPVPSFGETVFPVSAMANVPAPPVANLYPWLGGLLILGIVLRSVWLGIGLYRLHRLKLRTRHLPVPPHLRVLMEKLEISARIRVSAEVIGPVTFGYFRPVVVFPESFTELNEEMQSAVACHEALHVKRRDWLWNILDEVVRTLFWFHPGFHWLVGRIQLTREQIVDEQAVKLLGSRKTYLRSLLEFVKRGRNTYSLPAPLFLKESQLSHRVRLMVQLREVKLSKTKTIASLAACFGLLAVAGWWSLSALPMERPSVGRLAQVEPEERNAIPIPVEGNVMARRLLNRDDPEYPLVAKEAGIEGGVFLRVLIDKSGAIQEAEVVQGHPALRDAALDSLKTWRWEPIKVDGEAVPVTTTIAFNFVLKSRTHAPPLLLRIDATGSLWDGEALLDEERILQRAKDAGSSVSIHPDTDVSGTLLRDTVRHLKQSGIEHVYVPTSSQMEF